MYNYKALPSQTSAEVTFQLSLLCVKPYIANAQVLERIFKHVPGCLHIFIIFWRLYSLTNMLAAIRCRAVLILSSALLAYWEKREEWWIRARGEVCVGHNLVGMIANLCRYSHVRKLFCNQPPTPANPTHSEISNTKLWQWWTFNGL